MLIASMLALAAAQAAAPPYAGELIFPQERFHNHGSSIVVTPSGDLLACWFHGTGERQADDVVILGARKRAGANAWSAPFPMADTPSLPDCNPVLFIDPRGTLWLFWIAVQDNEWGGSLLKYRIAEEYTADGPPAWKWQDVVHCRPTNIEPLYTKALDEAEQKYAEILKSMPKEKAELAQVRAGLGHKLTQRLGWMTRLHPIMTSDTRMMLGLYSDVFNCSLAAFTEDWGATWSFSEPILTYEFGNIQPSFVLRKDGGITAFMRDNGLPQRVRVAQSTDNGVTWPTIGKLEIPNPGSSVECIALASGAWLLVCNDTTDGRHLLTAYLSDDEGASWKWKKALESVEKGKGSFSYPSVIQAKDGAIHCTYSYSIEGQGSAIKHAQFDEAWVRE